MSGVRALELGVYRQALDWLADEDAAGVGVVRPAARSWPPIRSDAGAGPRPGDRVLTWDGAELVVVRAGAVVEVDRWGDAAEEPTREVLSLAEWAWAWRDAYRRARGGAR